MLKNNLSHLEQDVYFTLLNNKNKVFTIGMMKGFEFSDYGTLKEILSDMTKKGWLVRIKRGTYFLSEGGKGVIEDMLEAATFLYGGYIAFSSALYVYNAITERPYTIYVATRNTSKSKIFGNIEIKAVALGRRALGVVRYDNYSISSKAKTLFDCFYLPEYAGGYSKVIAAVNSLQLTNADWREFLHYAELFDSNAAKRKTGYVLELANKIKGVVPRYVFDALRTEGTAVKLGAGRNGKYSKRWGIVDYIGEEHLLG